MCKRVIGLKNLLTFTTVLDLLNEFKLNYQLIFFTAEAERPEMKTLLHDVKTTSWFELGLNLNIEEDDMNIIQQNHRNDGHGALQATFRLWLKNCPRSECTWTSIVEALKAIGETRRAHELEEKYTIPHTKSL